SLMSPNSRQRGSTVRGLAGGPHPKKICSDPGRWVYIRTLRSPYWKFPPLLVRESQGQVAVYPVALQGEVNTWPGNGTVIRKIENFKARRPSAGETSSRRELPASVRPFSRPREQR